jgi:hypothetical protein
MTAVELGRLRTVLARVKRLVGPSPALDAAVAEAEQTGLELHAAQTALDQIRTEVGALEDAVVALTVAAHGRVVAAAIARAPRIKRRTPVRRGPGTA